jgi:hypothetical protein
MTLHFEDLPSIKQNLTFNAYRRYIGRGKANLKLPDAIFCKPQVYSNYGLFLSDQCPWRIVLRANGEERVFKGPMFMQMIHCVDLLRESVPFVTIFSRSPKFKRFPGPAVTEAMRNAVIHFDAIQNRDITVDLTEELVTITSPGKIPPDAFLDWESGPEPRNPKLAAFLDSICVLCSSARGLKVIRSCYSTSGLLPILVRGEDSFSIRLPSLDNVSLTVAEGKDVVLGYLEEHGKGGMLDLSICLMISVHRMKVILDELEAEGHIMVMGTGRSRTAFVVRQDSGYSKSEWVDIREPVPEGDCHRQRKGRSQRVGTSWMFSLIWLKCIQIPYRGAFSALQG